MKRKFPAFIVFALLFVSGGAGAESDRTTDIGKIISEGKFQPTVPDDSAFVSKYGMGSRAETHGTLFRSYQDKKNRTWVRLSIDTDPVPSERFVSEILVSSKAVSKKVKPANFGDRILSLRGVTLGASVSALRKLSGEGETSHGKISGQDYEVKRYYPVNGDPSLYNDFYIANGKVIAFSVGLTE
ncbi:hypothetical protein bcgnr5380_59140 [Bacillus cereus]|uniref:Uncharacterized protein n=2 Tax=Lysobacter enzymogenes TaxID=69 RepID=A0AAU9AEP8_LYSEN|nr:conserved hypothetical protein [Lysobacter enzymogenes]